MLQTCLKCGNESPTGDKFCRQCGEPFLVETSASAASTRNYVRQETPPSVVQGGSGYFPPSVADAIVGDTERYYQPQNVAAVPAQFIAQPVKKHRWRWTLWVLALLISAMLGSVVTIPLVRNRGRAPASPGQPVLSRADQEARSREMRRRSEWQGRILEAQERNIRAQENSRNAFEQLLEASERARETAREIRPTGEKPLDLSQYTYPGATSGSSNRITGYETLTMRTSDNFDTVRQYYEKLIGKPVIAMNEPFEKWLIFQSEKDPLSALYVVFEFEGQIRIVALRYPIRIAPIEDALSKKSTTTP